MNTTPKPQPQSSIEKMAPCPHLPAIATPWPAATLAAFPGNAPAADFYLTALRCAQSRWLDGLPAQALLMLNRAFSIDLPPDSPILLSAAWPYDAVAWILRHAPPDAFLGNPRRHYQHLATRMNPGPLRDLRVARAWACWAICRHTRPDFPADTAQLESENLREPAHAAIHTALTRHAGPRESQTWQAAMDADT